MNRTEWIKQYANEMSIKFDLALLFYSRNRIPVKFRTVTKKYSKSITVRKPDLVPTEGEYNLLVNNKYFQRFYKKYTNSKFDIGDLVCTKMAVQINSRFVYRYFVGLVTSVHRYVKENPISYQINFISSVEAAIPLYWEENRVKLAKFRNLDKLSSYHRR